MRIRILSLLLAPLCLGISPGAFAADMPVRAPMYTKAPPVVAFSWTGCFIGGNVGGIWSRNDWAVAPGDPSIGVAGIAVGTPFGSQNANGVIGGVQVGCDYQFAGGWVLGIQGDYDWTSARGRSADAVNNAFFATTGWIDETRLKSIASVTGRLGYAWDRVLGYVRGGGAWQRADYAIFNPGGTLSATAPTNTRSGWTVGVGAEYAFSNFVSAFVEYDYYDFGTRTNTLTSPLGAVFDIADIRSRASVVKGGINLRWNPSAR